MAFLNPVHAKLVRRSLNGPTRINDAAGTGKTVIVLHRAAYLSGYFDYGFHTPFNSAVAPAAMDAPSRQGRRCAAAQ